MAQIDEHFEAFIAERRTKGLGPAGERHFRSAWADFRRLPGSYRPTQETVRLFRFPAAGTRRDVDWRRARALHPILLFLKSRRAVSPALFINRPDPRRVEGRPALVETEVGDLVRAISDAGVYTLAGLVFLTGLRAESLIALTPDQVEPQNLRLFLPGQRLVTLRQDTARFIQDWQRRRNHLAPTFLHDDQGQPLTLKFASAELRRAGQLVGRPAIGFGHLQYAHTRLLARLFPEFSQRLLELRMQQSFRLKYLRIPNLYDQEPLRMPEGYVSPATYIVEIYKGEKS